MGTIDITTAHNIVVRYPLASLGQRIGAAILDLVFIGLYMSVIALVSGGSMVLYTILAAPIIGFYHLLFELFNDGQSLGKRIIKIRVVSLEGRAPDMETLFLRWVFRIMDIGLTFGMLAISSILISEKNQRIGDIIAGSSVINLQSSSHYNLKDLIDLGKNVSHTSYPGIIRYTDQDMLLVKNALIRYQKIGNKHNEDVLVSLRDKIMTDLNLPVETVKPRHVSKFLKNVLEDYIVLKR